MVPEQIKILAKSGHAAPSADNSQPWHFIWNGKTLSVEYDTERVQSLTFPPDWPATLLSIGAVIENITQAAQFLDLPLEIDLPLEMNDATGCYARIAAANMQGNKVKVEIHPLFKRHTNRFKFNKKPIPNDAIGTLSGLSEGNARLAVFSNKTSVGKIASLVMQASKIRFQTQELHEWLGRSLRFTEKSVKKADGLDIRTLDLPPGGGYFLRFISDWNNMKALNKLGLYNLLAQIDSRPIGRGPAIVAVIAPANSSTSIDAGRLLCRAWIYLNSLGIAAHPYYVVSDQLDRLRKNLLPDRLVEQARSIKTACDDLFELTSGETLHMLLRVGYPTREPPRSLRLPFDKVFADLTEG